MRRNIPMGSEHHPTSSPLALAVLLAVICGGGQTESPEDVRLDGTGARCSGWLEILHGGKWRRISGKKWTQKSAELACKQLGCGLPFGNVGPYFNNSEKQKTCLMECRGNETTLSDCIWHESNCTHHPGVALLCQDPVQTSTVSQPTTTPSATTSKPTDTPMIKLEDGTSLCSGTVELNFGGHWEMVCLGLQKWWNGLEPKSCHGTACEDLRGLKDLRSKESLSAPWEQAECERRNLSLRCLDGTETCLSITLVKCLGQDSKLGGSSTETALGILLGVVLAAVLLMVCVPPVYKRVMKKYSKKKHQWIGPHGVNQSDSNLENTVHLLKMASGLARRKTRKQRLSNVAFSKNTSEKQGMGGVSFHNNSAATLQPHPQSQLIQKEETNVFKRNIYLSPYAVRSNQNSDLLRKGLVLRFSNTEEFTQRITGLWNSLPEEVVTAISLDSFKKGLDKFMEDKALEGATNRISNPLDNSSDSDYDLCSAQPL